MKTLGESIRTRRKALGMSQIDLAEQIGVKRETLSRYENGKISLYIDMAYKIAKALGAELHYDSEANCIILKGGEPKHVQLKRVRGHRQSNVPAGVKGQHVAKERRA